jgi:hypothetical protein
VQLEIAKAIRTLTEPDDDELLRRRCDEIAALSRECETFKRDLQRCGEEALALAKAELHAALKIYSRSQMPAGNTRTAKAAVDDPKHPGWPAGTPDHKGGQFRPKDIAGNVPNEPTETPGIGHNQGPPLRDPPVIPPKPPATKQVINNFLKAAAYWLIDAEAAAATAVAAEFLAVLLTISWLAKYLPNIYTYLFPPKTLAELQQDALTPKFGYNIHHVVEQKSAKDYGFPDDKIDGPDNLVRIPTLRHWQISGWYGKQNKEFGGLSPRDYLRNKSWEERRRVGIDALIRFGVIKP